MQKISNELKGKRFYYKYIGLIAQSGGGGRKEECVYGILPIKSGVMKA